MQEAVGGVGDGYKNRLNEDDDDHSHSHGNEGCGVGAKHLPLVSLRALRGKWAFEGKWSSHQMLCPYDWGLLVPGIIVYNAVKIHHQPYR